MNRSDLEHNTPLHLAALGRVGARTVQLLLQQGADAQALNSSGWNAVRSLS